MRRSSRVRRDIGIGAFPDDPPFAPFHGSLDEPAIYASALSAAQVKEHYRAGTTGPSPFYADAVLRKTTSASFTADAVLKKTIAASYTADAVLRKTQSATFTLDAAIATLIGEDTFTRTVAPNLIGWGRSTPTGAFEWVSVVNTRFGALDSVDGSVAHVSGAGSSSFNQLTGYPILRSGIFQIDFQYQDAFGFGNLWFIRLGFAEGSDINGWILACQRGENPDDLEVEDTFGNFDTVGGLVDGDWVTVQVHGHRTSGTPTVLKIWKRTDPEPAGTNSQADSRNIGATPRFLVPNDQGGELLFDNAKWWSSESWSFYPFITADAIKQKTQSASFTVDAVIRRTQDFAEDTFLDMFTRTTSPGWGTADIGGSWTHNDSSRFSTNGSAGVAAIVNPNGSLLSARLAAVSILNVDETVKVKADVFEATGIVDAFVGARLTGDVTTGYAARLIWAPYDFTGNSLNIFVNKDLTDSIGSATLEGREGRPVADTYYYVRFRVTDISPTHLQCKVWKGREPGTVRLGRRHL